MRGADQQQSHIFSYVSPEERVRKDHPLRAIRALVDEVLQQLSPQFDAMYARVGRPSIPPEQLLLYFGQFLAPSPMSASLWHLKFRVASSAQNRTSIGFSSLQEQISGSSTERVGSMAPAAFPSDIDRTRRWSGEWSQSGSRVSRSRDLHLGNSERPRPGLLF